VPPTLVPPQPVVGGPLAARWLWHELPEFRAGVIRAGRAEIENAGSASWHPEGEGRICVSYHWLDPLGNPIVWAGFFSPIPHAVAPGEKVELEIGLSAPIPPGRYRLSLDLVSDGRCWFAELGNRPLELDVEVKPRDAAGAVPHLAEDVEPAPDWHELARAAHERGYAAVGGSLEVVAGRFGRVPRELLPYAPGGGRNPAFGEPLVCPSLLPPLVPNAEVAGLPAWRPEGDEPWLYDGRITARLRAGRRRA
jgi:hypothetical protein